MTSGSLKNYYRGEVNDSGNKAGNANNKTNNNQTATCKSFEYKTKIIGSTPNNNNILDAEIVVSLKHVCNFWRSLDLPLINCEIELDLRLIKHFVISEVSRTFKAVNPNAGPIVYEIAPQTTAATFQINNAKLYLPVVTLNINDNIRFLENIKERFKRTIFWNKFRSEIRTQSKNNNSEYVIDPTFRNINGLFVLSFKNGSDDTTRDSFDEYDMPLDFNALIDNKILFDQLVKLLKCQEIMIIQQKRY